ncbi:HIT-like protein [Phlebopus sp. FC_14]|nr:HIT-like protein [Phlebopus sp. FC_14]
MSELFGCLVFRKSFSQRPHRLEDAADVSESKTAARTRCVFCHAYSANRGGFNIVWEDADFLAFRDRSPSCLHHFQVIPKIHIASVKDLTNSDADMVRRMEEIGHSILEQHNVPHTQHRMGFHIPPFNSVHHLHLHVQALPYISLTRRLKYPVIGGFGPFEKGFSWFAEVGQTMRILERGSKVGVFPC